MSKKPDTPKRKRPDLTVRWTKEERAEIDELARDKGVKAAQVLRMAMREYAKSEKKRRTAGL